MELDILQIFSLLIVFVSLLLAAFLLTMRSENYLSNLLLAMFLVVSAIDSDGIFLGSYIYPNYPALGIFLSSMVFFKMPLLYLYLVSVVFSGFKLKWKHLWHGLPFLLNFIVFIPRFYAVGKEEQLEYLLSQTLSDREIEVQFSYILVHAQIIVYLILSFVLVNKYRRLLLENYSNASLFNYKWLFQFLTIYSIESIVASFKNLFMFFGSEDAYFYSMVITTLVALAYIIWMVMKTLRHPELFRGIDSKLQLVKSMVREDTELEKMTKGTADLNREEKEKINSLNTFMSEEEPFLDPSLTIYELSKQIGFPAKELSLLINHDLNQHFFDFVNGFRIRKAMEILADPDKKELTVLEILYEVGFNSKSSFNTAFKKYTQLTPTEYRRKHLRSAA
jgi:AraC-like DNA-binding protein